MQIKVDLLVTDAIICTYFKQRAEHDNSGKTSSINGVRSRVTICFNHFCVDCTLGVTMKNHKEFKDTKVYLTGPDSKLRPFLDAIAKFIDKLKGI